MEIPGSRRDPANGQNRRGGGEPPLLPDRETPPGPTAWSRRQVLGTLAAAAGMPILSRAGVPLRKVGVIGGGMAGVSLAWLLNGERDVVLFEARDSIGGNVQSTAVEVGGTPYQVDIGAQFFHPGPYPTYAALLILLGLFPEVSGESHPFAASITVEESSEPTPRFVSPVLPDRAWPLFAPWNQAGVQAFAVGLRAAQVREGLNVPWVQTMGHWLPRLGLTPAQWEGMLLPWAASLFTGDIEQARGFSARAAMIFAAKALPQNPIDPILYYVLNKGLGEALARMAAQFSTVEVLTGTPVTGVTRDPLGGFLIHYGNGLNRHVDDLVFASSGPPTRKLLEGLPGTAAQRAALQGIEFQDARLMLHTDPVYAPANPIFWSFLNCRIQGGFCEASMWLANVLTPPPGSPRPNIWKSWVTHRQTLPTQVLHESQFQHMVPTPASLIAQTALRSLQGLGGLWFTGGYTLPFDSQETALVSALSVVQGLQVASAQSRALVPG